MQNSDNWDEKWESWAWHLSISIYLFITRRLRYAVRTIPVIGMRRPCCSMPDTCTIGSNIMINLKFGLLVDCLWSVCAPINKINLLTVRKSDSTFNQVFGAAINIIEIAEPIVRLTRLPHVHYLLCRRIVAVVRIE